MALLDIAQYKKLQIEERRSSIEEYKLRLSPTTKSLAHSLKQERSGFIFEIKPASPSQGKIRTNVDITKIANIYAQFASAISVLSDEKYFGGSLANVLRVGSEQTCPVLCKDVVVSPLQIYEARYHRADAVLLMLSVLDDETYLSCRDVADALKMDSITEVHTEEEMRRACRLSAKIIGINNRDLKTLAIDMETTPRLLSLAPKNAIIISESGFHERSQILKLHGLVNGFLIGTSLMRASRIDLALRELLFGRVKICGLTNNEDARHAYEAGAYYGGLNFSSLSRRRVSLADAFTIKANVGLSWGGVFVNQPIHEIVDIATKLELDFVQIHGDEDEAYIKDLRSELKKPCEIWRAQRIKHQIEKNVFADRQLFDSYRTRDYGGTGECFDWRILADHDDRSFVLAGGIDPRNIVEASALKPFAIDIASGVEDEDPRKKSFLKLKEIFAKLWP